MFNSLGNLTADPTAALLFLDFDTGDVLQLSGCATVSWGDPDPAGDEADTGRRVQFTPQRVVATTMPELSETDHVAYPYNPQPTDRQP